jgi:hypothetical protein
MAGPALMRSLWGRMQIQSVSMFSLRRKEENHASTPEVLRSISHVVL